MQDKKISAPVAPFKLAAALETYEMDVRALPQAWRDPHLLRRLQAQFRELRLLGASIPKLSVSWVAVLVSRTRLLQAVSSRSGAAAAALHEHLADVEGLRKGCLRMIGAQGWALA
jgi:hypothetical protein